MWSLGCVMVEMVSSVPLFPAHNEHELLEFHQLFCGSHSQSMVAKSGNKKKFFEEKDGNFTLKPVAHSRIATMRKGTTSIVKSLFMKKKQKFLTEALGNKFAPDVEDSLILEHLEQEERDLVDFI
jgi:hypothetical protein